MRPAKAGYLDSIAAMLNTTQQVDALNSTKASLDRIQKQLNTSGRTLLQGFLLKRSETLRKWNQRWFTLDPTTGKFEYRIERGDIAAKGLINFDAGSSIIVSPLNLQGSIKYDGCCIYIQTSSKKEYFLCAESPKAAHAWVSTLRAAVLVLKAHKEAVRFLGGNGSSVLGTVAAAVAAANATAKEAAKEVAWVSQSSIVQASKLNNPEATDGLLDNLSIMKETLKVKDEELNQMAKDMRARDTTIQDLAQRLSATAEAAEAAASAAHIMDKEREAVRSEMAKLRKELDTKLQHSSHELKVMREKLSAAEKARDDALKETLLWQGELAKAREHAAVMQAALDQANEIKRHSSTDAEVKTKNICRHLAESEAGEVLSLSEAKEAKMEALAVPQAKAEARSVPQISNDALSLMDNGIEELLLDLEYVERKGGAEVAVKPSRTTSNDLL